LKLNNEKYQRRLSNNSNLMSLKSFNSHRSNLGNNESERYSTTSSSQSNNENFHSTYENYNLVTGNNSHSDRSNSENNNNFYNINSIKPNKISGGEGKNLINMKTMKNNNTLLSKLIDNYLEKKIVFNKKRPILSFTQTQKNKIKEYDNKIKIFKDGYRNQIYSFFSSLKNCGENEMSLCTGLNNDVEII
jgi:hypothetical protein